MNKLFKIFIIAATIAASVEANSAQYCEPNMSIHDFYAATIDHDGNVGCYYRWCYYTCEYDSYTIQGHYKPSRGTWEKDSDKSYVCYGNSNADCTFDYNSVLSHH